MDILKPLLNEEEQELADLVHDCFNEELNSIIKNDDTDSVISFDEKVVVVEDNLKHIQDLFDKASNARKKFVKSFVGWSRWRKLNIYELKSIAKTIRSDRFNSNVSKIVGGGVGILGGAAIVASVFCPPLAAVTVPLAVGGGVFSGLGGATVVGTAVTEQMLLKKRMNQAKDVLEQDKITFRDMEHWFEHTQELVNAVEEIIGFELMKTMVNDVKEILTEVGKLKSGKKLPNEKYLLVLRNCVQSMCSVGQVHMKFGMELAPVVMTFIFIVCFMCQRNRYILDCVILTHRLGMGLLSSVDVSVGVGRAVAGVVMKGSAAAGKAVPGALARAIALGAFASLGIALDVANVILASIDVKKGSLSQEGLKVSDAAEKLEVELNVLEEVYNQLIESIQ